MDFVGTTILLAGCAGSALVWITLAVIVIVIKHYIKKHKEEREAKLSSYRPEQEFDQRRYAGESATSSSRQLLSAALDTMPIALPPPTTGSLADRRILVADDSKTVRRMITMLLEPEGAEVQRASSGSATWLLLQQQRFDLLLVDESLPEINGYRIQEKIQHDPGVDYVPTILLTPQKGPSEPQRVASLGIRHTISKPFDSEQLIETISLALEDRAATAPASPACPVCEHPVEQGVERCPACGAVHHPECWQLNDGCGNCDFRF